MILRAALTVNEPLTCVMNSVCYKTHLCLHIPLELWLCWGQLPSALRWPEPSQAYKPLQPASPPSSCLLRAGISTCPQTGQPAGSTPWVQSSELTGRPATNLLPFLVLGPQGTIGPAAAGSPFSTRCTFPFLGELYLGSSENLVMILRNTLQQTSKGTFCWLVCCSLNQINLIHIESICLLFVSGKT